MSRSETQDLREKAGRAWEISWTRYYRPETNVFYDYISSRDPAHSQDHLPTVEEVRRLFPNVCGWRTGMEDSAISAGVWLAMICDRYDATGDWGMKAYADSVWSGMARLMAVSRSPGFLPRSVCLADGDSHYINSSRDQYTHYCHGLWRFYHSPLADEGQRAAMRPIIAGICARLERNVTPENEYSLCREDGAPGLVDKMWEVWCHEWARLPMIYLIGWDLTGDEHWRDLYRRYAWKAARESVTLPITFRCSWGLLQAVFSFEPLAAMEREDLNLRAAWLRAMEFYAGRMEGFSWQSLHYRPLDLATYDLDWRRWETETRPGGHVLPKFPDGIKMDSRTGRWTGEHECLREPGEALLAQLMTPGRPMPPDQIELLKKMLLQTDFDACITYGLFYPLAAYWRARKRGLL